MQSRTVYGKGLNTPKMQEIRIEAHGKGGAVGIKCVQTLVAHIESFKAAETPQEVYDRFMTVCGYCSCCRDAHSCTGYDCREPYQRAYEYAKAQFTNG
jgi:hypothetical protein